LYLEQPVRAGDFQHPDYQRLRAHQHQRAVPPVQRPGRQHQDAQTGRVQERQLGHVDRQLLYSALELHRKHLPQRSGCRRVRLAGQHHDRSVRPVRRRSPEHRHRGHLPPAVVVPGRRGIALSHLVVEVGDGLLGLHQLRHGEPPRGARDCPKHIRPVSWPGGPRQARGQLRFTGCDLLDYLFGQDMDFDVAALRGPA
jgi:hypothetical protein